MTAPFTLRIDDLELMPGTAEITRADIADRVAFARLLQVTPPTDWPPPLNNDDSLAYAARFMAENPDAVGFGSWYFVLTADGQRTLIGNGGFKGRPDSTGTVELGYSLLPPYQRRGYGTRIVGALVDWAFQQSDVRRIIAETLPELIPSIRVLEKNGFRHIGQGSEDGVIRLERARSLR